MKPLYRNEAATANEAFYVVNGDVQRSPVGLVGNHQAIGLEEVKLVSFDLDFHPLKKYLDNVMIAINQHASMINSVYSEVRTKINEIPLVESFTTIGASAGIFDTELYEQVAPELDKPRLESSGKALDDVTGRVSNKMNLYGHAITHIWKKQAEMEKTLRAKMKKSKGKMKKIIEDNAAKVNEKVLAAEKKVKDQEVNIMWKIKDFEDLLKTRINEKYVIDAVGALDDKLSRKFSSLTDNHHSHFTSLHNDLKSSHERLHDDFIEKNTKTSKKLDQIEGDVAKKLEKTKFEEIRKQLETRSDEISKKLSEYGAKTDPQLLKIHSTLAALQENLNETEQTLLAYGQKIDNVGTLRATLPVQVEFNTTSAHAMNVVHKSLENPIMPQFSATSMDKSFGIKTLSSTQGMGTMAGGSPQKFQETQQFGGDMPQQSFSASRLDKEKISAIEGEIKALKQTIANRGTFQMSPDHIPPQVLGEGGRVGHLELQMKSLGKEQQNLMAMVFKLQAETTDKLDKFNHLSETLKESRSTDDLILFEERLRKCQRDIDEVSKKVENWINICEKRIAKVRAELDHAPILKQLKDKAGEDSLKKEINNLDGKIKTLGETLSALKRDTAIYSHNPR